LAQDYCRTAGYINGFNRTYDQKLNPAAANPFDSSATTTDSRLSREGRGGRNNCGNDC